MKYSEQQHGARDGGNLGWDDTVKALENVQGSAPTPQAESAADSWLKAREVKITYTNHRGEIGVRRIQPLRMWFGKNDWHHTEQWLLRAVDLEKGEDRDFALKDVLRWEVPT